MISGIYCYENLINGKRYIGQAIDLHRRMIGHENSFKREYPLHHGSRENKPLWAAVNKYGRENFKYYVVCVCDKDELDNLEIYYIDFYKSHIKKNGYNLSLGGKGLRGFTPSSESRKKMAISHLGEVHTKEHNEKIGRGHVGMKYSLKNRKSSSKYVGIYQRSKTYGRSKVKHWVVDIRSNGVRFVKHFKTESDAVKCYNEYVISNNLDRPLAL